MDYCRINGKSRLRTALTLLLVLIPPLFAALGLVVWFFYLQVDHTLVAKFNGRRWDFPSKIYSDAYPLYPGLRIEQPRFLQRLARRGYYVVSQQPRQRGQYRLLADPPSIDIFMHAFEYPSYREPGRLLRIRLSPDRVIEAIEAPPAGKDLYSVLLEPALISGLHGDVNEERREMSIEEVPVPLVRAVIEVEDRRFFEHHGIDLRGLLRALVVNLRSGRVVQGGSTLTQQLMKNFFLTEERTLTRKLREAVMALVAEHRFSKLEILENYMNEIYMGQKGAVGVYGMWEAAKLYFGKEPRQLSLAEIATLAGMIRAPNAYSPQLHPERALERRNVVLKILLHTGEIDERAYKEARGEPLGAVPPPPLAAGAPYFVDFVRRELAGSFPRRVLEQEGYRIFTTLDLDLQGIAEQAVASGLARIEQQHPELLAEAAGQHLEAAFLAVNPRTGGIVAMVGGRDYRASQFNRAVDGRRQPGSVFKPIVVLTALGSQRLGRVHYLPTTIVDDEAFVWSYDGRSWMPSNYARKYYGHVTVRQALEHSLNTAVARIAYDVGIDAVRDMAVRLGIDEKIPAYPSIALGGWEVSPLEIVRVYSVFANAGLAAEPRAVSRVLDRRGSMVEGHPLEVQRVVSAADAYLVTHLLEGVIERGTGRRVRLFGFRRPAAGKTGTTNNFHDAWFAGYTPDLLAVVWVGFDRDHELGLSGAMAALPIWAEFMRQALAHKPPAAFAVPPGISLVDIDATTGLRATADCPDVIREAFLEGEEPASFCRLHGARRSQRAE